jgi:hypothetical protein
MKARAVDGGSAEVEVEVEVVVAAGSDTGSSLVDILWWVFLCVFGLQFFKAGRGWRVDAASVGAGRCRQLRGR